MIVSQRVFPSVFSVSRCGSFERWISLNMLRLFLCPFGLARKGAFEKCIFGAVTLVDSNDDPRASFPIEQTIHVTGLQRHYGLMVHMCDQISNLHLTILERSATRAEAQNSCCWLAHLLDHCYPNARRMKTMMLALGLAAVVPLPKIRTKLPAAKPEPTITFHDFTTSSPLLPHEQDLSEAGFVECLCCFCLHVHFVGNLH
mmetsp:Transcript_9593/g.13868  ORF Transcript_9593/g.13868 Transcript_9593/m.13868 type:complete len:201 (-) Transcript_9593:114-716(-)